MTELLLYGTLALLLLAAAIKFLLPPRPGALPGPEDPAGYFPVHCRYFPQMRHVFSPEDGLFLSGCASPALLRRWKAERKRAALTYLRSLRQDFTGLHKLARLLARHSRQLDARQQAQVAWFNLRFQIMYRLAVAQILLGLPAAGELYSMTRLLGSLSGRLSRTSLAWNASPGALTP